jgi:hypothetical protein
MDLRVFLDLQAAMRPTKIVQSSRKPTHPAMRPLGVGTGQGLTDLAPVAQTTRAVRPFHDPRMALFLPESVQHMLETRLPPAHPDLDALDVPRGGDFFPVAIGHPLRPPALGTSRTPCGAVARGGGTAPTGCSDGRLVARRRLRAERWQRSRTETTFGGVPHGSGVLGRAFPPHPRAEQLPVRSNRRMVPPVTRRLPLGRLAPLLLFVTPRPCSSKSRAVGVRPGTCCSWHRGACRLAPRNRRATGSFATGTRRAVARTLQPASRWLMTSAALASGSLGWHKALPRRSEHASPQVRQRHRRRRSWP